MTEKNISGELLTSVTEEVGHIKLNRPAAHNAINHQMWLGFPRAMDELREAKARAIVISGSGDAFAAGADLLELQALPDLAAAQAYWIAIEAALTAVFACEVPTIAQIDGACIGGGCLLALACDLRYATARSVFGIPVAKLGIVLDRGSIKRLVSLVGTGRAAELVLTGSTISGAQAVQMGLCNGVFESAELEVAIEAVARRLRANSENSLRSAKLMIAELASSQLAEDRRVIAESFVSDDFRKRARELLK
jgi:enoyl-CoA hydratase/carnithine racemase